jgi:hypothetical protein
MAFCVARKLEQQGKTLKGVVGVLSQYTVGVLFLMQDILEEFLGNQGQLQVTFVTGIVVENVIYDIVGIEVLILAFGSRDRETAPGRRTGLA